ncbi:MAG TPA: hypothetical protein VIJ82_21105 [Streptosporangiaceae bacterium]
MHITGNELAMVSAGVAAIAVAASVWNNKSTNANALAIAREERTSQQQNELTALKRTVYAKCIATAHKLVLAQVDLGVIRQERGQAKSPEDRRLLEEQWRAADRAVDSTVVEAGNAEAELLLIAPESIWRAVTAVYRDMGKTEVDVDATADALLKLRYLMRDDLNSSSPPAPSAPPQPEEPAS